MSAKPNMENLGGDSLPPRKPKKPRKQIVNERTRKLIGALLDDPDLTLKAAGEKAGYTKDPAQRAYHALKSPSAQELFRREMEKRPALRPSALADKLAQGLDATVTKFFAHEGEVVDERECVDFGARHSYLSLAAKLAGIDPTNKIDITTNGKEISSPATQQIAVLHQLTKEQLLALLGVVEPADAPVASPVAPVVEQVAPANDPDAPSSANGESDDGPDNDP